MSTESKRPSRWMFVDDMTLNRLYVCLICGEERQYMYDVTDGRTDADYREFMRWALDDANASRCGL